MAPHSTLLSDTMEEMDPRVLEFIKSHITTFPRWDIIRFLHENPGTQDTAENLARYVGRAPQVIAHEARKLESEGIFESETQQTHTVYRLAEDPELRQLIAALVEAYRDRTFRMKLVYHILRAGGQ
ncbi:MAG: winged helix-turn-helix transcriptional regulator [Anaerolineae bacterium]|nr:winged helix-turn-helix transcriptional regulator [Anaerolineae bacterium]